MRGPLDIHRDLLQEAVAHEIVHLPTVVSSAAEIPAALGMAPEACIEVRVVVVEPSGERLALGIPAGAHLEDALVDVMLESRHGRPQRWHHASAEEVSRTTGYHPRLVSPVGLPADVPFIIDAAAGTHLVVYAPTGDGGTVLGIRLRDLLAATQAHVATLTLEPAPRVLASLPA